MRATLEWMYYGTGSAARQDIETRVANGNEVDRDYTTGTLPSTVISTWAAMWAVVHELNGDGTRRYPKASMGVDLTIGNYAQ